MDRRVLLANLFPLVVLPVGGLLVLAICYLGYFALYLFIGSVFFTSAPASAPMLLAIRIGFAVLLLLLFLALQRTKAPDLLKASVLVGPLSMLLMAAILAFFLQLVLAGVVALAIVGLCVFLLIKFKRPWLYYYASALSLLAALVYGWPRG